MPEYLLPCQCGEQTIVSNAQAGDSIRCACGAELQVPSMRGLRELEPVARNSDSARSRVSWEDHHRVAFLFLLGAITCLGVAVYLWLSLPVPAEQPTAEIFGQAVDNATTTELFMIHYDAVRHNMGNPLTTEGERKTRQLLTWGIGIVLVLALAAFAGAAIVLTNRPASKK